MHAVQKVVRRHQGFGRCFPDADFKCFQIDLTQRPFAHIAAGKVAVCLLIVAAKMFDRYIASFVLLDALCDSRCDHPAQIGIFRIILKISAAERIPLDVERGSEPDIDAEELHFFPDDIPHLFAE